MASDLSSGKAPPQIFDRATLRRRRDRAAARLPETDFLLREVGARLVERLDEINHRFDRALDLGCHHGTLSELLAGHPLIGEILQADLSPRLAGMAARNGRPTLVADEEVLPFGAERLDLVLSLFGLQWVNDLPGTLAQIRYALRPGGLFLAAFPGGDTLIELRQALMQAESEIEGGVSARVSPFVELRDAGMLLQRVGFQLPMADGDSIPISYPDPMALLRDLRRMGGTNAAVGRRNAMMRRDTLARAMELYPRDAEGRIAASLQVIYLTGWAPER